MSANKEQTVSFKVSDEFAEWLRRESFDLDLPASAVIRSCLLVGMPLVKSIRGLDRLELEDLKAGAGSIRQK
jgi:hypothetical protein